MRFGLEGGRPCTLPEVSRHLQISQEKIKQLEAQIPRLSARQALREANRIETMAPVWAAPEYPPLVAAEARRMPLQEIHANAELHMRLRALAREATADAQALRTAGDLRAAAGLLDEVLQLGERLIGDPQAVGPPENDGVLDKLVGLAIAQIAPAPLNPILEELNDRDGLRRLEDRETELRMAHATADGHVRARYEARGGNWEADMRAAQAAVNARIQAIQEEGAGRQDEA
jgi:hypothetical protein